MAGVSEAKRAYNQSDNYIYIALTNHGLLHVKFTDVTFLETGKRSPCSLVHTMEVNCTECVTGQWELASLIYQDNVAALDIFTDHGVLPTDVNCDKCGKPAKLVCGPDDRLIWRCYRTYRPSPKRKPVRCHFKSSHFKGTFLPVENLPHWTLIANNGGVRRPVAGGRRWLSIPRLDLVGIWLGGGQGGAAFPC